MPSLEPKYLPLTWIDIIKHNFVSVRTTPKLLRVQTSNITNDHHFGVS